VLGYDKSTAAKYLKRWAREGRLHEKRSDLGGRNGTLLYQLAEREAEES
jgi:hypothetical protein